MERFHPKHLLRKKARSGLDRNSASWRLVRKQGDIVAQTVEYLKERGWTRRDLAQRSGMQESYLSRVLAGNANLTLKYLWPRCTIAIRSIFASKLLMCTSPLREHPRWVMLTRCGRKNLSLSSSVNHGAKAIFSQHGYRLTHRRQLSGFMARK